MATGVSTNLYLPSFKKDHVMIIRFFADGWFPARNT